MCAAHVCTRAYALAQELIMGFGHRVYKKCDPRNDIIKSFSREVLTPPAAPSACCAALTCRAAVRS
jgi:citrate synthase